LLAFHISNNYLDSPVAAMPTRSALIALAQDYVPSAK
jgi:hypothetical protein